MSAVSKNQDFAVIGLHGFGRNVARRLHEAGKSVLAIDPDMDQVEAMIDEVEQAVSLDPTNEDALAQVDITSFETVIVGLKHDFELTVLTVATLKSMGIARVICEVETTRQREILLKIGADQVVQPDLIAALQLANDLTAA
jgi:trk system potassium uptake protein TrkA